VASDKEGAARLGAHIVFVDESGFQHTPSVRKTWARRGKTPVMRHWQRRDKVSAVSGLSVSAKRKRIGLYWRLHIKNIQQAEVCEFLRHLLRHLRGHVIVIWDNLNTHRGEPIRDLCRRSQRLHLERLPAYAPELNADDGVWDHFKDALANGRPDDLTDLIEDLVDGLYALHASQSTLRNCIHRSELPPFCALNVAVLMHMPVVHCHRGRSLRVAAGCATNAHPFLLTGAVKRRRARQGPQRGVQKRKRLSSAPDAVRLARCACCSLLGREGWTTD